MNMNLKITFLFCLFLSTLTMGRAQPLDDVAERSLLEDRRVLPYESVREADILWEKRVWRVIDTREKMNLPFRYEEKPFIEILLEGVESGALTAYSPEADDFSLEMPQEELALQLYDRDTVRIVDPATYEETFQVVENAFDPAEVKRYRLKEVWFFDTKLSTMRVRILGIAPLREVFDENGNFRYETPMFWIHYPGSREWLAGYQVFNPLNDRGAMTWEDWLEMRFFASYITKESNVQDRRLEDYLSGVDLLLESERIEQEIFNYEHDLWSY